MVVVYDDSEEEDDSGEDDGEDDDDDEYGKDFVDDTEDSEDIKATYLPTPPSSDRDANEEAGSGNEEEVLSLAEELQMIDALPTHVMHSLHCS